MEGGREVVCMGCRDVVWGKKSKRQQGGWGRKERLRIEECPERARFMLFCMFQFIDCPRGSKISSIKITMLGTFATLQITSTQSVHLSAYTQETQGPLN
jgi:hypothetical protein